MNKLFLFISLFCWSIMAGAQQVYWVFLTDKAGSTFDPYEYFDTKAIARYQLNGFNLYDISNYPISETYAAAITALATDEVGQSRWLNAIAVEATHAQIESIKRLPFVKRCQAIKAKEIQLTKIPSTTGSQSSDTAVTDMDEEIFLSEQLYRMNGQLFHNNNIDGKGIRIAVFDGGFPRVDTHKAFRHLRDNHQIVKTWNFPNKKADVYGWNSHGTMTLSCIAGISTHKLGLATGSEFLLARTEVDLEPFKEEVWWMQAVEWADQNGADIISSSLGYGADRHYTKDMDGTSYVARAANMAARRGILVCNSAGNEGDDNSWKTIITPSDADSVLCVGGIEHSFNHYRHIDFSSYGPSADGRLKPNVCAFGKAEAASIASNAATEDVQGTSFSCPLVAGFAACAWQTMRDKTAMQMFKEIERSGDLYPYYDYALGYGVPQASYFIDSLHKEKEPTFRFDTTSSFVIVTPLIERGKSTLFWHLRNDDGTLLEYSSQEIDDLFPNSGIYFGLTSLASYTLAVSLEGYTATYKNPHPSGHTPLREVGDELVPLTPQDWEVDLLILNSDATTIYRNNQSSLKPSDWGNNSKYRYDIYWQTGSMINSADAEVTLRGYSPANRLGFRLLRSFAKPYCIGIGAEWGMTHYHLIKSQVNNLDNALGINVSDVTGKEMRQGDLSLELFQRIRFVAGGMLKSRGIYWDLGIYGSFSYYGYQVESKQNNSVAESVDVTYRSLDFKDRYPWNWGVTTRIGFDVIALYCRYRMTGLFSDETLPATPMPTDFYLHLPRLEAGVQIAF